jgi:hypothetical protein
MTCTSRIARVAIDSRLGLRLFEEDVGAVAADPGGEVCNAPGEDRGLSHRREVDAG